MKMCYCLQQHSAKSKILASHSSSPGARPQISRSFRKQLIIPFWLSNSLLILTSPPLPDLLNVFLAVESHRGGQRGTNTVKPTSTRRCYKRLCSLKVLPSLPQCPTVEYWEFICIRAAGVLVYAKTQVVNT